MVIIIINLLQCHIFSELLNICVEMYHTVHHNYTLLIMYKTINIAILCDDRCRSMLNRKDVLSTFNTLQQQLQI